jgi:hypothetical protein
MLRSRLTALAVVLVLATAQTAVRARAPQAAHDEVLTNDNVVAMTKAGIGSDVIVSKIASSKTAFDVSADGLVRVKHEGVDDDVIAAMIEASTAPPDAGTRRRTALRRTRSYGGQPYPTPPESGIFFERTPGEEGDIVLLEPNVYTQSKETGLWKQALTYGIAKVRYKAVLPGATARLQVDTRRPTFYFFFDVPNAGLSNAGTAWGPATSASEFILARFETRKKTRELSVGEYGGLTGHQYGVAEKASREFDYERLAPGVYRVTPKADLDDGEYCFLYSGAVATSGTAAGPKLFDFSVKGPKLP